MQNKHKCPTTCLACNISRLEKVRDQLDPRNSRDSILIEHLQTTVLRLYDLLWVETPPQQQRGIEDAVKHQVQVESL
jgi:hypothetical protein